jgi:hypothetical protein
MKRTTIFVPESLERDLQLYAKREGKAVAAVVREAVAEYIAGERSRAKLPSFTGAYTGPHTDTAERHEELLFKSLEPHGATPAQRKPTKPTKPKRRRR